MDRFLLLVQVGVAAWMVYEAIRAVTPIPAGIQSVLVAAACYGLTFAPPIVLLVLNASALVAFLRAVFARPLQVMPGSLGRPATERKNRITPLP